MEVVGSVLHGLDVISLDLSTYLAPAAIWPEREIEIEREREKERERERERERETETETERES